MGLLGVKYFSRYDGQQVHYGQHGVFIKNVTTYTAMEDASFSSWINRDEDIKEKSNLNHTRYSRHAHTCIYNTYTYADDEREERKSANNNNNINNNKNNNNNTCSSFPVKRGKTSLIYFIFTVSFFTSTPSSLLSYLLRIKSALFSFFLDSQRTARDNVLYITVDLKLCIAHLKSTKYLMPFATGFSAASTFITVRYVIQPHDYFYIRYTKNCM